MALVTQDLSVLTPQDLVNILLGPGVTITDIRVTGDFRAIGSFEDETRDGVGIFEGVILSSGNIADATGPNQEDGTTTSFGTEGDEDLDSLIPQSTNDAAILEIDFIPENEQFEFQYVFASEEYNEYVNSSFNDVFAFFLNGDNIALIPGTNTPVSINNVNNGANGAFYFNNDPSDLDTPPYNTEFDGFTTILAASALVTPGQEQTLKIAIADAGDSILDSAVFIQAGSLATLGQVDDAIITKAGQDVFTLESPSGTRGFANMDLTLTSTNTGQINEIGIFRVDDDNGTINGLKPGDDGYTQLALTGSRSRAIFTGLPDDMGTNTTRIIRNFNIGEKFAFYMIANGTTDEVLFDDLVDPPTTNTNIFDENGDRVQPTPKPSSPFSPGLNIYFGFPGQNPDDQDHLRVIQNSSNGSFTLSWEDELSYSNADFNDLVFNLSITPDQAPDGTRRQGEIQKEVIDLSAFSDSRTLQASFEVKSEAAYNNTVGLYRLANSQGAVLDPITGNTLLPEEAGYAQAALRNRVVSFDRNGNVTEGSNDINDFISDGGLIAPFIISNGTFQQWLNENPTNQGFATAIAYFPFIEANPDKTEHVVLLGDNTFGFEDLPGTNSDFDYDDMTLQINLF